MDKNKTNVPKIRFPGFTEPWEHSKFGDIVERISTSCTTDGLPRVEYEDIVSEQGMLNKDIHQKVSNKPGILFRNNDILYGKLRPYLKNWLLAGFEGIAVGDFWVYRSPENDSKFIYSLIQSDLYQAAANMSTGTKMPRADWSVVSNTEFYIPLNTEEQKKIGVFFIDLDNLITLHQRKLNHLQDKKKSLLQKMFPKNGEDFPELRFPEFTDPWEQRKLSELLFPADERNNAGKYTQDDVLAASLGTELVKKHIFFGLRSTEESVKNYRVVNSGDVIYTKSPIKGYPNGIIRTNKGLDGIVPSLYCVYHSIPSINSSIIQSYFEDKGRLDAYLYPLVNIGARNNVNITDLGFLEGTICISQDIDEQNKIVDFFNHLTNLITLHKHKLNHLQEQKKALLQQMFV